MRSSFPLSAVEATLRLAAAGLYGATVQLYLAGPDGRLAWAAASADGPDLAGVAETLDEHPTVLALDGVADAAGIGVGVAWSGASRGVLLALVAGSVPPPSARARVADAAAAVEALVAGADAAAVPRALVAGVAHDLRSPLTAILGFADLLDAASPPDEIAEARDVIARAGGQMLEALERFGADTGRSIPVVGLLPVEAVGEAGAVAAVPVAG